MKKLVARPLTRVGYTPVFANYRALVIATSCLRKFPDEDTYVVYSVSYHEEAFIAYHEETGRSDNDK